MKSWLSCIVFQLARSKLVHLLDSVVPFCSTQTTIVLEELIALSWAGQTSKPCAQCPWCRLFVSICSIKLWFKIYSHNNVLEWIKIIHLSSTRSWPNFPRPSCLWWRLYITFTISRDAMEESFSGLVMPISANYMVLYSRFSIFFYLSRKKICYFLVLSTLKKKKL